MTLTVREELKSRLSETTFIDWTKREFEDLLCRTQHARIKKDGTFYKNDKNLIHDLSKFSPVEFWESVRYFSGEHSPIEECRKIKGYSDCWIHHKTRYSCWPI